MIHRIMHDWLKDKSETFCNLAAIAFLMSIPLVCWGVFSFATRFGGLR